MSEQDELSNEDRIESQELFDIDHEQQLERMEAQIDGMADSIRDAESAANYYEQLLTAVCLSRGGRIVVGQEHVDIQNARTTLECHRDEKSRAIIITATL